MFFITKTDLIFLKKLVFSDPIPFKTRIYNNKMFFFPFFFKIKRNRRPAMLYFSFSKKEFFTTNSSLKWY